MDWQEQGYWHIYDHPATALQYLTTDQAYRPEDGSKSLNIIDNNSSFPQDKGIFYCKDISSQKYNKAITLDGFKEMDIDIVIASIPQHIEPFKKLINKYKPNAKLIYQIGNAWNVGQNQVKNVMASALVQIPAEIHSVTYHQEFDTNIFTFEPDISGNQISSFVNCFDTADIFKQDWELFTKVEKLMPEWEFKAFGGGCRNGAKHGEVGVAEAIGQSRLIWHTKRGGDGYGHIIHNVFAMGRPPIVNMSYYKNKMGGKLMVDGETCIAIDGLNPQEIVNKILRTDHKQMSINAHNKFVQEVDFEEDEKKIRSFLKLLQ
ncbi:MAG: hypothetical protein H8D23_23210 [Candidatus Brocadiales bacterium]|nr:hypothetical protein [Candidatus Brocadiales bacterium]